MDDLLSGRSTVESTTGNRPLSEVSVPVKRVEIVAFPTNTGRVWIGDRKVSSAAALWVGMPLSAGEIYTIENIDLSKIYLAVSVANEGITWNEKV